MSEHVRTELCEDGGLLRVVFERSGGNVLTGAVMRELDATLAAHELHPHLRLVTLEGHGKHFSFGASVEEHQRDQAAEMLATFHAMIRRLARYPVPTAAIVRGRCLGGAFEVALACRFVFAASGAVFACPEIKLGVIPPVLAALGPARLGVPATERLLLTGADLPASAGATLGFVTELAADGADPWDAAVAWYRASLRGLSAWSLRQGVAALALGAGLDRATGETLSRIEKLYLDQLLPSHDGNAGIEAFLAKSQPQWKDQ
ncbi:MAG: enoyl-CoA hydratase/isomerase family protein [Polyangiaceae bacterium]|nr:enoyl-CoA hydratase/isomerase family protein [Polyangiaceae bacterium]